MLKMTLFGPPRVELNGEQIDFGTRKAVALLGYLATSSRDHTRTELATFLWPDYEDRGAASSLGSTLHTIKKNGVTEQFIRRNRQTVGLIRSPTFWIDLHAFQDAILACRMYQPLEVDECPDYIDTLTDAVSLYQGDFMAGFTLKDSANFDDWQMINRVHFQREFINVLEVLVDCYSHQQNYAAATAYSLRLVECDPFEEQHHRSLMRLYALDGKRTTAIHQYEVCCKILSDELGIAPSEDTTRLYEAIKSMTFQANNSTDNSLNATFDRKDASPIDHTPTSDVIVQRYEDADMIFEKPRQLVGREKILDQLVNRIFAKERLLLTGLGGIGKTSLAATAAAEYLDDADGPVLWVSIGHAPAHVILKHIAALESANPGSSVEDQSTAVRKLLLEQKGLVVLDNALDDRTLFYIMRAIPPSIPTIVTSRHIIPIEGEIIHVSSLSVTNAVKLLSHHARIDYVEDLDAADLCACLGYHPYAIEIAGKHLQLSANLTPKRLLTKISAAPHDLAVPGDYAPFRRESVKVLLDSSVEALPTEARRVFTILGRLDVSSCLYLAAHAHPGGRSIGCQTSFRHSFNAMD